MDDCPARELKSQCGISKQVSTESRRQLSDSQRDPEPSASFTEPGPARLLGLGLWLWLGPNIIRASEKAMGA